MTPSWRRHAGDSPVPESRKWRCSCGHEWDGSIPQCPVEENDPSRDHRVSRADAAQKRSSADAKRDQVDVEGESKTSPDEAH